MWFFKIHSCTLISNHWRFYYLSFLSFRLTLFLLASSRRTEGHWLALRPLTPHLKHFSNDFLTFFFFKLKTFWSPWCRIHIQSIFCVNVCHSRMFWFDCCCCCFRINVFMSCKTNMIPILMHQMHIWTTQVSSVALRPKKLEIQNKYSEKCLKAKKILCHEIDPNSRKNTAIHERDNPLFWDEFVKFTFFLTVLFMFVFSSKYWST
jgi:hypothetical protein